MGDLVRRSELLKRIAHHTVHDSLKRITFEEANTYEQVKGDMFNLVQKAPVVDAVPVAHGRWEKVQVWKDSPQTTLRCSLCKTNQPIYEHEEWKFCPFCGQPMDAKDMDVPTKDGGA